MKNSGRSAVHVLVLLLLFAVITVQPITAATHYWVGGVSSGNWNSGGSWVSGSAPVAFDSLVFTNVSHVNNTANNDFTAGRPFNGITFDNSSASSSFNLTGNGIVLSGATNNLNIGVTNNTGLPETVSLNLTLDW